MPEPRSVEEWARTVEFTCLCRPGEVYCKGHRQVVKILVAYAAQQTAALSDQIGRLADFIMREIPGEPSQSQGAVDTAIRLLKQIVVLREQNEIDVINGEAWAERAREAERERDTLRAEVERGEGQNDPLESA